MNHQNTPEFREYIPGDEEAVYTLVKIVLNSHGLVTNPQETDKDISDIARYYVNNNGWFEVIEYRGEIIGSYGIYRIDQTTCELRKMYLYPEFQGRGLGRRMMERAFNKAVELGCTRMILETNKKLDRAIKLYKKYGFKEYKPDHWSDRCNYAMIKTL